MKGNESYTLTSAKTCERLMKEHPDYKVFWRSGFAYRGAGESEDDKQPREQYVWEERRKRLVTFEERMERRYDWSAAIDVDVDHDAKEIHMNGFSENDMF